jgi:hypothetical protein
MRNVKFAGIHFARNSVSGVAKINVVDTTTSTGIVIDDYIDLNLASITDPDAYESFVYWVKIDPTDHEYSITVENISGEVGIIEYLLSEELTGEAVTTIEAYHSDYPYYVNTFTLMPNDAIDLKQQIVFNGDGTRKRFILSEAGACYAYKPIKFSKDGGATWSYPEDFDITWGGNVPDYDDEQVGTTYPGIFAVEFSVAPITSTGNVIIEFAPLINRARVTTTLKLPTDSDTGFAETTKNMRLLDHGIEFIP